MIFFKKIKKLNLKILKTFLYNSPCWEKSNVIKNQVQRMPQENFCG